MSFTLAQDRINCRSRQKVKAKWLLSLALTPLTDRPIRSERKDVVDQVTNPRASSLRPPMSKNLVQVLSALLIHSGAHLFCGGMHAANIREHAQLSWASPIRPTRWVSYHGGHWKVLMHACIMESCRNFHRVLSLRGNFGVGQQRMGRARLHTWRYLGLVYRECIPNTQHLSQILTASRHGHICQDIMSIFWVLSMTTIQTVHGIKSGYSVLGLYSTCLNPMTVGQWMLQMLCPKTWLEMPAVP